MFLAMFIMRSARRGKIARAFSCLEIGGSVLPAKPYCMIFGRHVIPPSMSDE